jgi:hypothetical protein
MPSPFPGMDPYIESQKWEDFHTRFMAAVSDALVALLRPRYIVEVEKRIYVEGHDIDQPVKSLVADAAIFELNVANHRSSSATAVLDEPDVKKTICTIPYWEERRETFLTIRRGSPAEVVTVIELLSPTNKRKGTDGRNLYVEKLNQLLRSRSHVVEIDLLRKGEHSLLMHRPTGDYFVMTSRTKQRPLAEMIGWPMLHRLPSISIPLAAPDPDVVLHLQDVFQMVYDRAGYDYSIDYQEVGQPALPNK